MDNLIKVKSGCVKTIRFKDFSHNTEKPTDNILEVKTGKSISYEL